MRQYKEVPPWLAAANTPKVKSTSGLGTGGGAGIDTPDSGGFGDIDIFLGLSLTANGSVTITFPSTPPTLFISGPEGFGALSQATVGNDVTISWTADVDIPRKRRYRIHYEWETSY